MRTTLSVLLFTIVITALTLMTATNIHAQRRTVNRRAPSTAAAATAESEANKFWERYVPACNGARYLRKAASIFVELTAFASPPKANRRPPPTG